jgi:hypothetical protein
MEPEKCTNDYNDLIDALYNDDMERANDIIRYYKININPRNINIDKYITGSEDPNTLLLPIKPDISEIISFDDHLLFEIYVNIFKKKREYRAIYCLKMIVMNNAIKIARYYFINVTKNYSNLKLMSCILIYNNFKMLSSIIDLINKDHLDILLNASLTDVIYSINAPVSFLIPLCDINMIKLLLDKIIENKCDFGTYKGYTMLDNLILNRNHKHLDQLRNRFDIPLQNYPKDPIDNVVNLLFNYGLNDSKLEKTGESKNIVYIKACRLRRKNALKKIKNFCNWYWFWIPDTYLAQKHQHKMKMKYSILPLIEYH